MTHLPGALRIIETLGLEPLPGEGGYFRRTYPEDPSLNSSLAMSAIYYLETSEPDGFSSWHQLNHDEVYHFYLGDPVELFFISSGGKWNRDILGTDLDSGQRPQITVPAGSVQASRILGGGEWALMGTTVSPSFEWSGFSVPEMAPYLTRFPDKTDIIQQLMKGDPS